MTKSKKNSYSVPAVDGMLDIIEFMAQDQQAYCGVTQLSKELGLSNNLVFRVMRRLEDRSYVERDASSGGYRLSSGFFTLGMRLYSRFELRHIARKHLARLSETLGETTQLQILSGHEMLALEVITPPSDFFLQVIPGSRLQVHCNSYGKAILAFMEPDDIDEILPKKLKKLTPNTITSKLVLRKEFEQIRRTGISHDNEEYNTGIFCVGAPVFDVNGDIVASLGVTGLSTRFCEKRLPEAEKMVLECAIKVSSEIGYNGDFFNKLKVKK
jgi:IclR family transcriptional regulator, KDG regulon repressor